MGTGQPVETREHIVGFKEEIGRTCGVRAPVPPGGPERTLSGWRYCGFFAASSASFSRAPFSMFVIA